MHKAMAYVADASPFRAKIKDEHFRCHMRPNCMAIRAQEQSNRVHSPTHMIKSHPKSSGRHGAKIQCTACGQSNPERQFKWCHTCRTKWRTYKYTRRALCDCGQMASRIMSGAVVCERCFNIDSKRTQHDKNTKAKIQSVDLH